jgi:hypothetical protein
VVLRFTGTGKALKIVPIFLFFSAACVLTDYCWMQSPKEDWKLIICSVRK